MIHDASRKMRKRFIIVRKRRKRFIIVLIDVGGGGKEDKKGNKETKNTKQYGTETTGKG